MAGEFLFRLFDLGRYHELLPCLDELASTRKLSDGALATVKLALALPDESRRRHASEVGDLQRIVSNRELEPRVFLSPKARDHAITPLVELLCLEEGGRSSLVERVGSSWVVLEASLGALSGVPWFEDIAWGRSPGSTELAYPRGESSLLSMRGPFDELVAGLQAVSRTPGLDEGARDEVGGLMALVSRAQSRGWSLAYSTLL
jgi:hypothetical protein